jgi:hypothetical protein
LGRTRRLSALTRVAGAGCTLRRVGRGLTGLAGRLLGGLPQLADGASYTLTHSSDCLPRSIAKSLTEPTHSLTGAVGELADGSAGTDGLPSCLPDVVERLADGAARPQRLLAELSDAADCVVERIHQPLEDLWIPIQRGQRTIEDVVQVLQPNLELRLSLDALDVHFHFAQVHVDARDDLEQVCQLRTQREMGLELLDVDIDLVDLDLADVDEDIGVRARLAALQMRRVELACAPGARGSARARLLEPLPFRARLVVEVRRFEFDLFVATTVPPDSS